MVFGCLLLTLMDHLTEVVFLGLLHCSYSFHFMIECCSAEIKDQISQIELSAGSVENTLAREENYSSSLLDQNCLNRQSIDLVCFWTSQFSLLLEMPLSPLALHPPVELLQHRWQE